VSKAILLGDNGTDGEEEGFDPFRRRVSRTQLDGGQGRAVRVLRQSVGAAVHGLGGPRPVPYTPGTPTGPGGRPVIEQGDMAQV